MPYQLGRLPVDRWPLAAEQLDAAPARQQKVERPLGQTLIDLDLTTVEDILRAPSEQFRVPLTRVALRQITNGINAETSDRYFA